MDFTVGANVAVCVFSPFNFGKTHVKFTVCRVPLSGLKVLRCGAASPTAGSGTRSPDGGAAPSAVAPQPCRPHTCLSALCPPGPAFLGLRVGGIRQWVPFCAWLFSQKHAFEVQPWGGVGARSFSRLRPVLGVDGPRVTHSLADGPASCFHLWGL